MPRLAVGQQAARRVTIWWSRSSPLTSSLVAARQKEMTFRPVDPVKSAPRIYCVGTYGAKLLVLSTSSWTCCWITLFSDAAAAFLASPGGLHHLIGPTCATWSIAHATAYGQGVSMSSSLSGDGLECKRSQSTLQIQPSGCYVNPRYHCVREGNAGGGVGLGPRYRCAEPASRDGYGARGGGLSG